MEDGLFFSVATSFGVTSFFETSHQRGPADSDLPAMRVSSDGPESSIASSAKRQMFSDRSPPDMS